jgi:hypothetical protein
LRQLTNYGLKYAMLPSWMVRLTSRNKRASGTTRGLGAWEELNCEPFALRIDPGARVSTIKINWASIYIDLYEVMTFRPARICRCNTKSDR